MFSILVDKKIIKNFIESELSQKTDNRVSFDEDIIISFFPKPKIILKKLEIHATSNFFFVDSEKVLVHTSWISLLKQKPKVENIEIFSPKISINFSKNKTDKFKQQINFSKKNHLKNLNKKIRYYSSFLSFLKVYNGELILYFDSNIEKLPFDLTMSNNKEIDLKGKLLYEKIDSKVFFEINTVDFDISKLKLRVHANSSKDIILINGDLSLIENIIGFKGKLVSEFIDIESLTQIIKEKFAIRNNRFNVYKANLSKKLSSKVNLEINSYIKKIKYSKYFLEDSTFMIMADNKEIIVKDFKSNFLNSDLKLDTRYEFKKKNIKGLLIFDKFKMPKIQLNNLDYYLSDGDGFATISFESNLASGEKSFLEGFKSKGKVNIIDSNLYGIDINEFLEKIENLNKLSDLLSALNLKNKKGSTKIKNINIDFYSLKNDVFIQKCITKNEKIEILSNGKYKVNNEYIDIKNKVSIKNLPPFEIDIVGKPQAYKFKYNVETLKEYFFNKSLKKIMKNNNNKIIINPGDILDFLKDGENKKIDTKKLIEDLF